MSEIKSKRGGARPGAGRKPNKQQIKPLAQVPQAELVDGKNVATVTVMPKPPAGAVDMLQMLQAVALGLVEASPIQVRAAIAAVQYTHTKKGDGGKKEERAEKAKLAGAGRFKSARPPLKLVGGS